jgi:hypothetical protein
MISAVYVFMLQHCMEIQFFPYHAFHLIFSSGGLIDTDFSKIQCLLGENS